MLTKNILVPVDFSPTSRMADVDWFERMHEQACLTLDAMARRARAAHVPVEIALEGESAADAILKHAGAVDLIALSIETKGIIERLMLGTTAERVIREASVPVLCIPADSAPAMTPLRVDSCCAQPA
jgi:nucleotide-binding universal stress UspA family protein